MSAIQGLGFLAGLPRSIRCIGCKQLVDTTKDGFLARHKNRQTRHVCDRSGMSVALVRKAWAERESE